MSLSTISVVLNSLRLLWRGRAAPFDWPGLLRQIIPLLLGFLGFQVLFTAEPDGRIFSWSATNGTTALQRQLFSAHDQGKAWHALAGVKTLDPAL